jgi:fructose-1,6-bisphosphatase II
MTETAPAPTAAERQVGAPCLCEGYARVTERAALAAARWLGRADQEAAEEAAFSGMRLALEQMPIDGHIVIGGSEEGEHLPLGGRIGSGGTPADLALDPLEGRAVVARGGYGAMSLIAAGAPGSLPTLPDMYMRKMAVGPVARGKIDLLRPIEENVVAIADAALARVPTRDRRRAGARDRRDQPPVRHRRPRSH